MPVAHSSVTTSVAIIGPGKTGIALARAAAQAGFSALAVGGRNPERTKIACKNLGASTMLCSMEEAARFGDLIIVTVPDDVIENICGRLADLQCFRPGAVVLHCSGALDSSKLAAAQEKSKCFTASAHPLQSFIDGAALPADTHWFLEGDKIAITAAEHFINAIGGHPHTIGRNLKPLYHAAAVFSCNYLVVLQHIAGSLGAGAGIDKEILLQALKPLVTTTVHNVFSKSPAQALTGPIERGDIDTVRAHLAALAAHQEFAAAYRNLGFIAVGIAEEKKTITPQTAAALRHELTMSS